MKFKAALLPSFLFLLGLAVGWTIRYFNSSIGSQPVATSAADKLAPPTSAKIEGGLGKVSESPASPRGNEGVLTEEFIKKEIARCEAIPSFSERKKQLGELVKKWARQSPKEAFSYAVSRKSLALATELSLIALESIASTNPRLAAELVQNVKIKGLRENLVGAVAKQFTAQSPAEAAKWALSLPDASSRANAIAEIAGTWSATAPEDCLNWVNTIKDPMLRQRSLSSAFNSWAEVNLNAALAKVDSMPQNEDREVVVSEIAKTAGVADPEAVAAWLNKFPGNENYRGDMAALFSYMTETNPLAAVTALNNISPNYADAAYHSIASTWASNDPSAAINWIQSIPDSNTRVDLLVSATSFWAQDDPSGALAYARNLGDAALKDAALFGNGQALNNADPRAAFNLAQEIANPTFRQDLLNNSVISLASSDLGAAKDLVKTANLNAQERSTLNALLENRPPN